MIAAPVPPILRLRGKGELSDLAVAVLAAATALGAWVARPMPVWPLAMAALVALALRRPLVLGVVVMLLASALSAQAWQGTRPAPTGSWSGRATLLTDPERLGGAMHAEVRADGHHFDLWARGRPGAILSDRAAGQVLDIHGRTAPRADGDDWAARRHIVGRIDADQVQAAGDGDPVARVANALRTTLLRGASALAPDDRALFAGFVLGDDRGQSVAVADDFRGAGLTHLLVVSGENLAFVLVVAMPLLRRLGLRGRWLATLAVVGLFGVITRFEPSVLRASAMAAIVVTAWMLGRPVSGIRTLALAVVGLVLVDPMLVGVLGFQLSVAASAGILVLARPLTDHLPVPGRIAPALGVTLAAQVAVGPLLAGRSGGMPVAGVIANLLAEPAAALIMAWGLTAGMLAGLVGQPMAGVLHLPTSVLVRWVEWGARQGAALPLGQVGIAPLALAAVAA
ncbi:MAG: ComEC/Rec2 family competence protein, partial [Acidimicrobiales bacterium]